MEAKTKKEPTLHEALEARGLLRAEALGNYRYTIRRKDNGDYLTEGTANDVWNFLKHFDREKCVGPGFGCVVCDEEAV